MSIELMFQKLNFDGENRDLRLVVPDISSKMYLSDFLALEHAYALQSRVEAWILTLNQIIKNSSNSRKFSIIS